MYIAFNRRVNHVRDSQVGTFFRPVDVRMVIWIDFKVPRGDRSNEIEVLSFALLLNPLVQVPKSVTFFTGQKRAVPVHVQ